MGALLLSGYLMQKLLIVGCVCFAVAVGSSSVVVAGFYDGVTAFDNGDYKTALREFRVSAIKGDARAQYNLGVMYRTGKGVSKDYKEADRWYRNASERGHVQAQFSLGLMYKVGLIGKKYKKGTGIVINYVKAYKWFSIAASSGHAISKKNLRIIEGQMTSGDISKAQKLAQEWMRVWPIKSP